MVQSLSWEANSFSATQDISHIFWNQKAHYCVNNSQTLVTILTQMNPAYILPCYFVRSILIWSPIYAWVF